MEYVMNFLKFFLVLLIVLISDQVFAVGISVSGPSSAIMSPGTTTKTVRYYISYSFGGDPWTSSLHYRIDGGSRVPSNEDGSGANNPSYVDIPISQGSHTITFEWMAYDWSRGLWYYADTETKNITIRFKVFVKNNFGAGNIKVDNTTRTSGYYKLVKGADNIGLEALEQSYNSYDYIWSTSGSNPSQWERIPYQNSRANFSTSRSTTYSVSSSDNYTTLEAGLRKVCNITFKNQHSSGEEGGTIKVNGTTYSSPTTEFDVVENTGISGYAIDHTINGIRFSFSKWTPGNFTSRSKTFYPTTHENYEANFIGRPTNSYRNQHFNTNVTGQHIKVYWSQHPNSNVTKYKIYRKTKFSSEVCVATINRTGSNSHTYSWTDPIYVYTTNTSTTNLLSYDVRAYYAPDATLSDYDWRSVYGDEGYGDTKNEQQSEKRAMLVDNNNYEYGISNYPNPYNPTTTISYSVKDQGNVSIVVYDALGRKVKELVNEIKQPGSYNVIFDGINLSSGIYFYTMRVNNFTTSKKMILSK